MIRKAMMTAAAASLLAAPLAAQDVTRTAAPVASENELGGISGMPLGEVLGLAAAIAVSVFFAMELLEDDDDAVSV